MQLMCIVVTIGTTIQTAAVNMGMFLAGRVLAGYAVGGLVGTVPIYLSEISAPHQRGLIGGISGCGISFGTLLRSGMVLMVGLIISTRHYDLQLGWYGMWLRRIWNNTVETSSRFENIIL